VDNTRYEFIGWEAILQDWLPRILGAAVILLAAWFIGKAVKWALARGIDKLPGAGRHNEGLEPRQTVGARLGDVALWTILLFGVVAALGVLNLGGAVTPLNTLLNQIASAVPSILAAALIFFIGFIVATLARRVVSAALQAANADAWLQKTGVTRTTGSTGVSDAIGTLVFVLILIPVTVAALERLNISVITEPAVAVLNTVLAALPRVIVAGVLLAIGLFVGRWVGSVIERILPATGFDRSMQSLMGLSSLKPTASSAPPPSASPYAGAMSPAYEAQVTGDKPSTPMTPSKVVGMIATIAIVLAFAYEATRQLQFAGFSEAIEAVLALAGRVLVGGVIITVGVLLADVLANVINRSTQGADKFASTLVKWATISLAVAMGLSFMGIADEIVVLAFGLILGSAAVAAALAFGLGGREWAGRMLNQWSQQAQAQRQQQQQPSDGGRSYAEPEPRPFHAQGPEDRI